MKQTNLIIALLVIALLGTIGFGALYLTRRNPVETITANIPVTVIKPKAPSFKFAFYGEGQNKLKKPMAVAVGNGKIYVSDAELNKVLVFELDGKFVNSFGQAGTKEGQFQFPYGLAVDEDGLLYVADRDNRRIQVFDATGKFLRVLAGPDRVGSAAGLYYRAGLLYVAELQGRVSVFKLSGEKVLEIKPTGDQTLSFPNAVAVDKGGKIYVADSNNYRVSVFDPKGQFLSFFQGSTSADNNPFGLPRGIAISNKDVVLVVAGMSHQVHGLSLAGEEYFRFGKMGTENNEFLFPNGIFVDSSGRVYVTDTQNHGVKVYGY